MASICKNKKRSYSIRLPKNYFLTEEKLQELQSCNPDLQLCIGDENLLNVVEHKFLFDDYGYLNLKLTGLTAELFEEMHELNEEINFEFDDTEEVWIKMGAFRLISKLTAAIISSFFVWASSNKMGEVYSENGEYELNDPKGSGKKIRRIPDASYISYKTASEETQDSWDGFIPIPPNMAMEIVSAKYGLKGDLDKMEKIWMLMGVDVGIVVCPFSESIYVFEKGKTGRTTQNIYDDFSHPLLPGYTDNYGKYTMIRVISVINMIRFI
ncbi:MAG: Uma2 family endonuclease [Leptospiraceae bacterium]|nr:Uma2 family endonuclease [Leptospiraceae bacterium]